MLLEGVGNIQEAIAKLNKTGFARDLLIIDTPGSMMRIVKAAVAVADCVILPVQASILDMIAQEEAALVVDEANKDSRLLVVLSRVDGREDVEDSVKRVISRLRNRPIQINQRIAYKRAHIAGQSGAEIDRECSTEISRLWAAVQKILKEEHDGQDAYG